MKKTAILFLSLASAVAFGQNFPKADDVRQAPDMPAKKVNPEATPESVVTFWSEDFSSGIPATWSQNGTPSTAAWEYRGPSTSPDITVGSRGAFNAGTGVINSSSASNGFVIFDSDYLDNGGNPNNMGAGTAPAPHVGRLTTDVIDLSSEPSVELKFESYARRFQAGFHVAFSVDGGSTFTDTIEFYPESSVGVNESTSNAATSTAIVSSVIGGQSQVVLQFIFDGTRSNANGSGYYFWQLDDVELRTPPTDELRFTGVTTPTGTAPPRDILHDGGTAPKYGHMNDHQIVPISFDANFYNYGTSNQTNVALEVEIWDANSGMMVTSVTSPACASLAQNDTCDFNTLTTPTWTPSAVGDYIIVYKGISDAISSANTTATDTVNFFLSETDYGLDRNVIDNYVGTNSANPELIAMAVMVDVSNADPDSSGLVFLDGVTMGMSAATDSTADMEFAIYDTTGYPNSAGSPIYTNVVTLDPSVPGTRAFFSFAQEDSVYDNTTQTWTDYPNPLALPTGAYYLQVTFFPNATDGVVRVANDASFGHGFSLMQLADGNWYGGFTSSTYEAPHIRVQVADAPPYDISIKEEDVNNSFSVYPNPTNGIGNIQFEMGGTYDVKVYDMVGNVVRSANETVNANQRIGMDFSDLPGGVYLLSVKGEGVNKTVKLTVK